MKIIVFIEFMESCIAPVKSNGKNLFAYKSKNRKYLSHKIRYVLWAYSIYSAAIQLIELFFAMPKFYVPISVNFRKIYVCVYAMYVSSWCYVPISSHIIFNLINLKRLRTSTVRIRIETGYFQLLYARCAEYVW